MWISSWGSNVDMDKICNAAGDVRELYFNFIFVIYYV